MVSGGLLKRFTKKGAVTSIGFRDRVMFPLRNDRGQIIGFAGRALLPDDAMPKYLNTPRKLLFHKSRLLYEFPSR